MNVDIGILLNILKCIIAHSKQAYSECLIASAFIFAVCHESSVTYSYAANLL